VIKESLVLLHSLPAVMGPGQDTILGFLKESFPPVVLPQRQWHGLTVGTRSRSPPQ